MANGQRIDELRRRIDLDPASILFAQLAEEHRRAGQFEEAVRVCRAGLARHPGYLAARVTLGRALIELGDFDQAHLELDSVIRAAPYNIAAKRSLVELQQRQDPAPVGRLALVDDPVRAGQLALVDDSSHVVERAPVDDSGRVGNPALLELERWLDAIAADRAARHGDSPNAARRPLPSPARP